MEVTSNFSNPALPSQAALERSYCTILKDFIVDLLQRIWSCVALIFCCQCAQVESSQSPASFDQATRLLLLDGDDGTVACRIYGNTMSATIPRFSDNWTVECASRSILRMNNLIAVRGLPGASMVGPMDYFGNLENPHQYLYTIQNSFPPVFYRTPITNENAARTPSLQPFDSSVVTTIRSRWMRGRNLDPQTVERYHVSIQHSLFDSPGVLEVDRDRIELQYFDPRGVDLSSFKAHLVDNSVPFQITKRPLPSKDNYRLITYSYEPGYADWQIQHGSGLFLETHDFSQTITPITPDSKGYVVLARRNSHPGELELIAVQIPYGSTLIVDEDCIHGDTTLNGFFMMGMTSDHTTMRTANSVFLKFPGTGENVQMHMMGRPAAIDANDVQVPPNYMIYKNPSPADRQRFKNLTQGKNFIFNPSSREYFS